MKAITLSILISFCLSTGLYAQKPPIKFGKVSKEELELAECEFYPEAKSMVLCKYGVLRFEYNDNQGWRYKMHITVRKKIFDKTDKDAANINIYFYEPAKSTKREVISGLKAITYNLEGGDVEKVKLQSSQVHETRTNDYGKKLSFAMPNIQEGSVFEYTYTITSTFLTNLQTWKFQEYVPIAHSEFIYEIPEYFYYQISQEGHVLPMKREVKNTQNNYFNVPGGVINAKHTQIIAENVPPIIEEPYVNNRIDLPNRVEFQLSQYIIPGSVNENFGRTYPEFSKELLEAENFGKRLDKGSFAKDWAGSLAGKSEHEKAKWIYSKIQKIMSYNELKTFTSKKAGTPALKEAKGSAADINLTLIAAFRELGLKAHPIILSTRGSGRPHPTYPNYEDFNYVIALVMIGEQAYLADASSPLPLGMLPYRCLNGEGWVVMEKSGTWVDLKKGASFAQSVSIHSKIGEEEITSSVRVTESDRAAVYRLTKYNSEGEEKFSSSIAESFPDAELDSLSFKLSDEKIATTTRFTLTQEAEEDNVIYYKPLNFGIFTENLFTREKRTAPIDFAYTYKKNLMIQVEVPKGYEAEIPKPTMIRLPNKKGVFTYQVMQNGTMLMINAQFKLEQTDFTHEEYPGLKQLFELMEEKNNQVIVLKKT